MKAICTAVLTATLAPAVVAADAIYLQDRGTGVGTSMFGTYVSRGEWIRYPFVEYYSDEDLEYAPEESGVDGDRDFRGRYRAKEALLFVAYGVTGDLAVEFEAAVIDASFDKSPEDSSALPTSNIAKSPISPFSTRRSSSSRSFPSFS